MPFSNATVCDILCIRRVFEVKIILNNEIIKYFSVRLILFLGTDYRTSIHFVPHASNESLGIDF